MQKFRRAVTTATLTVMLSGGLVALSATSASAAACGSGRGCAGQDPYAEGCTAASSITKTYTSGAAVATFVNEYSTACNANWVFAYENTAAEDAGWNLAINVSTADSAKDGEYMCSPNPVLETDTGSPDIIEDCRGTYAGADGWPMWTDMVDGTNKSYGNLTIFNSLGVPVATVPNNQ